MDFDNINEHVEASVNKLAQSANCSDSDFANANPGLCPNESRLVLKPERVTRCGYGGVIKFETFLSAYNTETHVTVGLTYESSNTAVLTVNAGGVGTIIGPGDATVSVTNGSLNAHARVHILGGDACCDDISVVTALAIDNSRSMGQAFGVEYPTKLYVAKELAGRYAAATDTSKDKVGVLTFNEAAPEELTPSDSLSALDAAIEAVGGTLNLTDISHAVKRALSVLESSQGVDRRVLVVLSDGEARPSMKLQEYESMAEQVQAFKDGGGIVIACGIRAKSDGYVLLRNLGSAGFFLNVFGENAIQAGIDYLLGTMGYFCAADPLGGGYGYGYVSVAQVPDTTPLEESELYDRSAG